MRRIMVFSRTGAPLGEINPNDVLAAVLREEINGEHSLEITTTQVLEKGVRLLHQDGQGKWREFSVSGVDADHSAGLSVVGTYYCPWSMQEDMMGVTVSVMPGVQSPVTAGSALRSMLDAQARWTVGTVTNTATGGASMYDRSAWEAMSTLVETWGGEVDAAIGVDDSGVITRSVCLYAKQGEQTAKRRFDFAADARGIVRTLPDEPLYCRISPRGKGEQTDAGGYGRKITIASVNGGKDYLEYAPMVDVAKMPNGASGYIYPTKIIENSDCETPADLKAWAQSVLESECTPQVSYSLDVLQSDEVGTSIQGVALGDAVQVVDKKFGEGLRIEVRVTSIEVDLVAEQVNSVELGAAVESIASKFASVDRSVSAMANQLTTMSTAEYVNDLIGRLNAEINATGGYTYIVPGQGIVTYDKEVSDPSVGAEADAVVEVRGGTIRIANSRTQQGEWDWKTVFTSGHIAANLVTAVNIVAGFIGSAESGNFWNLDTGELQMANTATILDDEGNPVTVGNMVQLAQDASTDATNAVAAAQEASEVAQAAANAQVGGTNLLIDSNHSAFAKRAADANRASGTNLSAITRTLVKLATSDRPVGGADYAFQMAFPNTANGKYALIKYYDEKGVKLIDGQTYTVSCWARKKSGTADVAFQIGQTSYRASDRVGLSTKWKRYSWTFGFSQSAVGGSDGARVYFVGYSTAATAATVQIAGMKLEVGDKATDWSLAPEDVNFGIANAEALAKTYTNAVSEADREYTASQRAALDASFDQGKVFNRLTNNGKSKGIVLKNGQLYINGTYIQTDTLNAGIIKTGILTDKKGLNRWNMATGYMATTNAEFKNSTVTGYFTSGTTNKAQFNNGTVRFFNGTKNALTIDGALKFADGGYGAHITYPKNLVLRGPNIAVDDRTTGNGMIGDTYTLGVYIPTVSGGYSKNKSSNANYKHPSYNPGKWDPYKPKWMVLELSFINGICVSAQLA